MQVEEVERTVLTELQVQAEAAVVEGQTQLQAQMMPKMEKMEKVAVVEVLTQRSIFPSLRSPLIHVRLVPVVLARPPTPAHLAAAQHLQYLALR